MVIKKLNKFIVMFFLFITANILSCKDVSKEKNNNKQNEPKSNIKLEKLDNEVIFFDTILVNNTKYTRQTNINYSVHYNLVHLINKKDTITFSIDELYIQDTIYDINNDGDMDFIVKYSSTSGLVQFIYLYDKSKKRLAIIPDTLHNFISIDEKSFFQMFNEFKFMKYEKFNWSNVKNIEKTYLINLSDKNLLYYKVVNKDTINIILSDIQKKDREAIEKHNRKE